MGIVSEIGGFLVAGGGGGILGLVGSGVNRFMKHKETKTANAHALSMAEIETAKDNRRHEHEVKLHALNIEAMQAETEREVMVTRERGSWEGLTASHATAAVEAQNFKGSIWVENLKGATRPVMSFLLWVIVSFIYSLAPNELRLIIGESVVFCASASTLWWFGDRAPNYKHVPMGGPL